MKGLFAKLKYFSPKLKVLEILLFLKPQNQWKKPALESIASKELSEYLNKNVCYLIFNSLMLHNSKYSVVSFNQSALGVSW